MSIVKIQHKKHSFLRATQHLLVLFIVLQGLLAQISSSQSKAKNINGLKEEAPKIYVDCSHCDLGYIKTEITFVNYVWDRKEADVHVLITTQKTASGGKEYTIFFIGQKKFKNMQSTLKYYSKGIDSWDEVRKGLVHILKLGLAPYISQTPLAPHLSVSFRGKSKSTQVKDKWNFWVFSLSLHSFLNGEKSIKSESLWSNFSANRVTSSSKFKIAIHENSKEEKFKINGTSICSSSKEWGLEGLYVKSVDEHWSAGGWMGVSHSTYKNIDLTLSIAPAIEYDLFPYSQFTRKQLRLLYKISYIRNRYIEETIYDKTAEGLFQHSLSTTLEFKEPWGNASASIKGSNYLHDFHKNRLIIFSHLGLRIFKGLSLSLFGSYSAIHDQLNLSKAKTTLEEILLQRKELESNYRYSLSVGFTYKFGSIYSNVVNPRFGSY